MQTGVSIKAGAAFLAGVVLALGGAFTYYKVADPSNRPPSQTATKAVDTPSSVPDLSSVKPVEPPPVADAAPVDAAPKPEVKSVSQPKITHVAAAPKVLMPRPRITSRPVSLAVAKAPTPYTQVAYAQAPPPSPSIAAPTDLPVVTAPKPEPVQTPPPQPHTVTIPADTTVSVRLTEKLSTDHNYSGDTFRASLDAPIIVDGFIIADRGAKVLGTIVKSQKPGKMEGAAELSLTLTEISTTDGQQIHVQTNESLRNGPSNTGRNLEKMGGGAALGAIIGAIAGGGKGAAIGAAAGGAAGTGAVLLGHGKPAVFDNETRLTFQLSDPTTVTEKLK